MFQLKFSHLHRKIKPLSQLTDSNTFVIHAGRVFFLTQKDIKKKKREREQRITTPPKLSPAIDVTEKKQLRNIHIQASEKIQAVVLKYC